MVRLRAIFILKCSFGYLAQEPDLRRERVSLILLSTINALDGTAFLYNKAVEVSTLPVRLGADESVIIVVAPETLFARH